MSKYSDVLVNRSQTDNPLLKESKMNYTPWKFDNSIIFDYFISPKIQFLFLSLKYHKLRPEYIWEKIKKTNIGITSKANENKILKILLILVDIESPQSLLNQLSLMCIKNNFATILAWSFEEAGNYIVFAKQNDNSPHISRESIRGFKSNDYNSSLIDSFTSINLINKTDVSNLLATFGSVKNIVLKICDENIKEMEFINGFGKKKLFNLKSLFHKSFISNKEKNSHNSQNI